ncbi:response regulator [Altererythrobacter sp. BO-6]|uniref:ATP-binding response regulator n=1 Tax=Altererythrobacter sp. BO-6 TaxID=2604537 RepID=UPI0013E1D0BA|nr:hybrid sensor histidine kinase/response regulator [Altererythrobacter sp. BO-6]QIG54549.1 response regulator [Altererythrobacter sp. BO-6]
MTSTSLPAAAPAEIFDEYRAEIGQAKVRLAMIVAASCYLALRWAGFGPTLLDPEIAIHSLTYFGCFAIFSLLMFADILRRPGHYPLRRIASMVGDYGSLAYIMIVGGAPSMPFYALILWVTVGNGMRFGQRYLLMATAMAQLTLVALLVFSTYWRGQFELMLTFSITALALPTYALVLLRYTARARDAAMEAMLAKSRFLAQASHDLRQPIHAIGYHIEALRGGQLDVPQRQVVDRIERSLGGVARLFKSLLDISKLDSGNVEVRESTVALGPLLAEIAQQVEEQLDWHEVELRVVPTGLSVRADPTLLTTMVLNLLTNGIKYSKGSQVLLGVRRRGATVSIEVHDQGIGIDKEHLPKIFEEFYRGHEAGDHDVEGVGLGLSIVRRLAMHCGFAVDLQSVRGRGTTARLTGIPMAAAKRSPAVREAQRTSAIGPLGGLGVILIEDDVDVLEATYQLLERWGCDVQAFSAPPEIVSYADIIIADFDLGGGATGVEVIADIRAQFGWRVPALIITGHALERVRGLIDQQDVMVLPKPVQPATLRSALSAIKLGLFANPRQPSAS